MHACRFMYDSSMFYFGEKKPHNKTLDWEHIFTIKYDFGLNELLISCSLIRCKVVFKFRCGVGFRDVEYEWLEGKKIME